MDLLAPLFFKLREKLPFRYFSKKTAFAARHEKRQISEPPDSWRADPPLHMSVRDPMTNTYVLIISHGFFFAKTGRPSSKKRKLCGLWQNPNGLSLFHPQRGLALFRQDPIPLGFHNLKLDFKK